MSVSSAEHLKIRLPDKSCVSALLCAPQAPRFGYVFAHGAGAGIDHPFMEAFVRDLAGHDVATLRFQFPFMERKVKRVDPPAVAQAAIRAAVAEATQRLPKLSWFAGGKSYGGRMTSQAQSKAPLVGMAGLVFVGFPLHAAGKPSVERAAHLTEVQCPMLFLQGTRDALADLDLVRRVVAGLKPRATLEIFDEADHSFHVRKRSGQTDYQVRASMVEAMVDWCTRQLQSEPPGKPQRS